MPAILAGLAYSWLYKKLDDIVPENLKLVIPPLVSLVVMVPLTVIVIGVALGVFLKAKNQEVKSFSMTGVITIVLSAIIEPTLFGLLVNNKKLFAAQIIAGAVGGAYLGLMRVVTSAFVFGSVVTFPAFVNGDMMNFVNAMVGLGISTVVGAVLGYMFCEQDMELA